MHPQSAKALPLRALKAVQAQEKSTLWWVTPTSSPFCFCYWSAGISMQQTPQKLDFPSAVTVWKHGLLECSGIPSYTKTNKCCSDTCLKAGALCLQLGNRIKHGPVLQESALSCACTGDCPWELNQEQEQHKNLKAGKLHDSEQDKTPTLCSSHTNPEWFPSPWFHSHPNPQFPSAHLSQLNIVLFTVIPV